MQNEQLSPLFMTPAQLQTELLRCEFCEEKPCREACPVNCSPADFIMAARLGNPSDLQAFGRRDHACQPSGRHLRHGLPGYALHGSLYA